MNRLDTEITRNIMLGRGVQESAAAIAKEFKTSVSRAATLVYTETAYVASEAQRQCFKELGVEQYEIVATLDNLTSEICQSMDGQHFPMKDFKPGVTAPPFHPNCRSVTVPYFDDEYSEIFEKGERAARDEDGKKVFVPEDMKYKDWKAVFVDKSMSMEAMKQSNALSYIDITNNLYPDSVPNSHIVKDLMEYMTPDGSIYHVNGKNIKISPSVRERDVADILEQNIGGPLYIVPKITQPEKVRTPDYIFNGETYDLKEIEGNGRNTCYNNVKAAKGQADNVILDITKTEMSIGTVEEQIKDVFRSTHTSFVDKIIIIKEDKILKIYKRK